jgi:SulP family sulfate permease
VINVKSGGRGRLSTFCAGIFLLFFILVLGQWVARIPMGALVAVMIMVSVGTFEWRSLTAMRKLPVGESLVMVGTVATVVLTHDLARGVLVGIVLSALLFARKVAKLVAVDSRSSDDGRRRAYRVTGELFFVSVEALEAGFDYREVVEHVSIDFTHSHVWDASAVAAIDRVVLKFRSRGVPVELLGLNEASATLLGQLATHDKPGAALTAGH